MGVTFHAEGLAYEDAYDCGYAIFDKYRIDLAHAIHPVVGRIYESVVMGDAEYEETGEHDVLMLSLCIEDIEDSERMSAESIQDELRRLCPDGVRDGGLQFRPVLGDSSSVDMRITYDAVNEMMRNAYGEDLASFLSAPDSEGELTGDECGGVLRDLDRVGKVDVPTIGHNYGETVLSVDTEGHREVKIRYYPMHSQFLGMFRHCAENNVSLVWG